MVKLEQKVKKGDMRWEWYGNLLAVQWKDNKIVNMLSSIDIATESAGVNRKVKVDGVWTIAEVKQPMVISRCHKFMNAVDKSDQILSTNVLRKCLGYYFT